MKKIIRIISLIGILSIVFLSCGKDKAPQDSDLFVGTYSGSISYMSDTDSKSSSTGKVTVAKAGDVYSFVFSDGIPNITGIKFEKEDDEYYINIGGSGTSYIRINSSKLKILYLVDGQVWTADCTR